MDSGRVPESRVEEGGGGLARAIGPRLLLLFIIGDMLGTGIYVRVGAVAGEHLVRVAENDTFVIENTRVQRG